MHYRGDYGDVEADNLPSVALVLKDDELAGVVVSHTELNVVEGERATYSVRLTQAPNEGESVTVTVGVPAGVNVAPQSVILNAGNWNTGATIRVTPGTDNVDDTSTETVSHTIASSDEEEGKYKDVNEASTVTLNVSDPKKGS